MNRNLAISSIIGALAVIFGAFGAHILKSKLSPEALQSFDTGVRYQMYHAIILLFINMFSGFSIETKNLLTYIFLVGIIFFSGSIYLIHLTKITAKSIWFITPLGGLFLIFGWFLMAFKYYK